MKKQPVNATELNRWAVLKRRWKRKQRSRASPEAIIIIIIIIMRDRRPTQLARMQRRN